MDTSKFFEGMRKGDLELHCTEVVITQRSAELELKGHGKLLINPTGLIYLELVCKPIEIPEKSTILSKVPQSPFDENQKLELKATTIQGWTFEATDFSFQMNNIFTTKPFVVNIPLELIELHYESSFISEHRTNLNFEICEPCRIPTNKLNTVKASLKGYESYNWNQTLIEIDKPKCEISIIDHEAYMEINASGDFNIDEIYESLNYYLALSSGRLPQPYAVVRRSGHAHTLQLRSVNKAYRSHTIAEPFPALASAPGWPDFHYGILSGMLKVRRTNPNLFQSGYAQWARVWHAYRSQTSVTLLTLGVAIEGLLNDVYIPSLELSQQDTELEKAKIDIILKLNNLAISKDHKATLVSSVEKWGNMHPKKALSILVERGIVDKDERQSWIDLRNSSAHPKAAGVSNAISKKDFKRMCDCLSLFYIFSLSIFGYQGPVYKFGKINHPDLLQREMINIVLPENSKGALDE